MKIHPLKISSEMAELNDMRISSKIAARKDRELRLKVRIVGWIIYIPLLIWSIMILLTHSK